MVGPNARWAPEQLEHRKTPKSNEAPNLKQSVQVGAMLPQSAQPLFEGLYRIGLRIFSWSSNENITWLLISNY